MQFLSGSGRFWLLLMLLGGLAGLCGWWLVEESARAGLDERSVLGLSALSFGFFAMLLALTGPVALHSALFPATVVSMAFAGLFWQASFRHETVSSYLELIYPLMAFGMALLIATPLVSSGLQKDGGWRDYPTLFATSWRIIVRYMAAALFTALFWGVLSLSDALLRIVGLELIEWITRVDAVAWGMTGAVFGLALAVVHELADYISPYLVLRLLRLFMPPVLLVSLVFTVLLALRGWEGLLDGLSPAATLIAFAIAAIVLVTISIERDSQDAVRLPFMRFCVQVLALMVPVLGGLALWAVWLRIGQYGLTPPRLIAATLAAVCLAYGLAYALSVLLRRGWMGRIREANIWLAFFGIATCLAWLSPLVNPESLTARSQLARALDGADEKDLPLLELARDWGKPGQQALAALEEARPELAGDIAQARSGLRAVPDPLPVDRDTVLVVLPVYPKGISLPEVALDGLSAQEVQRWLRLCDNRLPSGAPGCALFLSDFAPQNDREQALLFLRSASDFVELRAMRLAEGRLTYAGSAVMLGEPAVVRISDDDLQALHEGQASLVVPDWQVLRLGDRQIFPNN